MLLKQVWITTQFVGFHRWKDATGEQSFLKDWHRHVFHVKLSVLVTDSNREVEFIDLKNKVDDFLQRRLSQGKFEYSCEQIAEQLLKYFQAHEVTVSEDGENGATVTSLDI